MAVCAICRSGGSTTALPFLHTVAHVFARWPAAACIVCSSFRSDDTTELVLKCCATLGMKRDVLYDKLTHALGEEAALVEEGQDVCLIERFSALS